MLKFQNLYKRKQVEFGETKIFQEIEIIYRPNMSLSEMGEIYKSLIPYEKWKKDKIGPKPEMSRKKISWKYNITQTKVAKIISKNYPPDLSYLKG